MMAALLLFLLLVAPTVSAITFTNTQPLFQLQSGSVLWRAHTTVTVNSVTVKAWEVDIDGLSYNFTPAAGQLTVTVTSWAADKKEWNLSTSVVTTAVFKWKNPGDNYTFTVDGQAVSTCPNTSPTCTWDVPSGSAWKAKLTAPGAGSDGGSEQPQPAPLSAGGGGGGDSAAPKTRDVLSALAPPLPSPGEVFPQFSAVQWLAALVGLVLFLNGTTPTQRLLPRFLHMHLNKQAMLFSGSAILAILYLSPTSV